MDDGQHTSAKKHTERNTNGYDHEKTCARHSITCCKEIIGTFRSSLWMNSTSYPAEQCCLWMCQEVNSLEINNILSNLFDWISNEDSTRSPKRYELHTHRCCGRARSLRPILSRRTAGATSGRFRYTSQSACFRRETSRASRSMWRQRSRQLKLKRCNPLSQGLFVIFGTMQWEYRSCNMSK